MDTGSLRSCPALQGLPVPLGPSAHPHAEFPMAGQPQDRREGRGGQGL